MANQFVKCPSPKKITLKQRLRSLVGVKVGFSDTKGNNFERTPLKIGKTSKGETTYNGIPFSQIASITRPFNGDKFPPIRIRLTLRRRPNQARDVIDRFLVCIGSNFVEVIEVFLRTGTKLRVFYPLHEVIRVVCGVKKPVLFPTCPMPNKITLEQRLKAFIGKRVSGFNFLRDFEGTLRKVTNDFIIVDKTRVQIGGNRLLFIKVPNQTNARKTNALLEIGFRAGPFDSKKQRRLRVKLIQIGSNFIETNNFIFNLAVIRNLVCKSKS